MAYTTHVLFIHSSVYGHLEDSMYCCSWQNSATINKGREMSQHTDFISFGYVPSGGLARSSGSSSSGDFCKMAILIYIPTDSI
jgi:hypothetical protein